MLNNVIPTAVGKRLFCFSILYADICLVRFKRPLPEPAVLKLRPPRPSAVPRGSRLTFNNNNTATCNHLRSNHLDRRLHAYQAKKTRAINAAKRANNRDEPLFSFFRVALDLQIHNVPCDVVLRAVVALLAYIAVLGNRTNNRVPKITNPSVKGTNHKKKSENKNRREEIGQTLVATDRPE